MDGYRGKVAVFETPYLAVEFRCAETPARVKYQIGEKAEFPSAQRDALSIPRKDARAGVEDEGAEGEGRRAPCVAGFAIAEARFVLDAAEEGRDAGREDPGRKGLGDEVVGTEAQAFKLVLVGFAGRYDDDGREAGPAKGPEKFQPVHAGESEVEEDKVGEFIHRGEGGLGRGGVDDAVTVAAEIGDDEFGYGQIVFNKEDESAFHCFRHS